MATRKRASAAERELAELEADPSPEALLRALASEHPRVVWRAAEIVRRDELGGLGAALRDAFERLVPLGVAGDPGCRAKLALLEALDAGEWPDDAVFVAATRVVQREGGTPLKPGDSATGVRARGILALARMRWSDTALLASELLLDPEPPVRLAAADALAAHGVRDAAGALIAALARDEDDPMVVIACFSALLALAPEWALEVARRGLPGPRFVERELAAIALGSSRREDALDLLVGWVASTPGAEARAELLHAIGLHRTTRALDVLLARLREGPEADVRAVIDALVSRRFDPGVLERARDAAAERAPAVQRALEQALARE